MSAQSREDRAEPRLPPKVPTTDALLGSTRRRHYILMEAPSPTLKTFRDLAANILVPDNTAHLQRSKGVYFLDESALF